MPTKPFFAGLALLAALWGCNRGSGVELSPSNNLLVPTPAPPQPFALFEDFEAGAPASPATYSGGTSPVASWDATQAVSGTHSLKLVVSGANGGYGGANFASNYGNQNATGAQTVDFWMRTDTTLSGGFTVRFSENGAGIQNENWRSPAQNMAAGPGWQAYSIPVTAFVEDDFGDPSCSGSCSSQGNNSMELGAIDKFEIQFIAFAGTANIYVDDIRFTY